MRLLYAYFDFDGLYGMDECGINFSTTDLFSVNKQANGIYAITHKEKDESEIIPESFWGSKRLYNITAIVGNNGAGKSTLLHSIIRSTVLGLHPGVPFLLILQETLSRKKSPTKYLVFGRDKSGTEKIDITSSEGEQLYTECSEYPTALKKTKVLLIDNTLSVRSIDLETEYIKNVLGDSPASKHKQCFWQLYNKSLAASVRHSNYMSLDGRKDSAKTPLETLSIYFRYESFQELRVLFDRSHWNLMQAMRKKKLPVPNPHFVDVSVDNANQICKNYFSNREIDWMTVRDNAPSSFMNRIYVGLLFSIFDQMTRLWRKAGSIDDEFPKEFGCYAETKITLNHVIHALDIWRKWVDNGNLQNSKEILSDYHGFVEFLKDNESIIVPLFQPAQEAATKKEAENYRNKHETNDIGYQINIEDTIKDAVKRNCFMSLLQKYRKTSDHIYYLSFSAGLSSGEMNVLRMLTQLRYALAGPSEGFKDFQKDKNLDEDVHNALRSYFPDQEPRICDSLVLFLDEADLTYHPDWQRKLIYILAEYLPGLFKADYFGDSKEGCRDIQVVLATHSPLLLSDIPLQCCVFLKKDEDSDRIVVEENPAIRQTFGANIHDLLNNAFFLERSIGERAYHQIVKMFDDLKKLELNPKADRLRRRCEPYIKTIKLIGDPIIQNKMLNQYYRCFSDKADIQSAITAITAISQLGSNLTAHEREEMIAKLKQAEENLRQ